MWLNVSFEKNWAELRGLALAGFTAVGVIALINGKIEMEIEEGRESIITQAHTDFVMAVTAAHGKPTAAA
jgi:hypothetical protein